MGGDRLSEDRDRGHSADQIALGVLGNGFNRLQVGRVGHGQSHVAGIIERDRQAHVPPRKVGRQISGGFGWKLGEQRRVDGGNHEFASQKAHELLLAQQAHLGERDGRRDSMLGAMRSNLGDIGFAQQTRALQHGGEGAQLAVYHKTPVSRAASNERHKTVVGAKCPVARLMRYLDHNATTPLDSRARAAMERWFEQASWGGNPSSRHGLGREAREQLESARRQVAEATGATALGVTFTSGGTEADNLAVLGGVRGLKTQGRPSGLLTTRIEHPAVTSAARALATDGGAVTWFGVGSQGEIDLERLAETLAADPEIGFVSLAAANHELGNAYDVAQLVATIREIRPEIIIHCDAVQAMGKMAVDLEAWGVDMLSISAHKFGGPTGIGALVHRKTLKLAPCTFGGEQERGRRVGTENVIGIVGMGEAAIWTRCEWPERRAYTQALQQRLVTGLRAMGARIHGFTDPEQSTGNTVNAAFSGCEGELVTIALDLEGFAVSTGTACSAGSSEPSPVLLGMGCSEQQAMEAIRFSLGPSNVVEDIDALLDLLPTVVDRIRGVAAEFDG